MSTNAGSLHLSSLYLDSSALVKLVLNEAESDSLKQALAAWRIRYSCSLVRVEVVRAVAPHGHDAIMRARQMLGDIDLITLDDAILDDAALLGPPVLRTLVAIHLAAMRHLGRGVDALATYDIRMIAAAEALQMTVISPGRP